MTARDQLADRIALILDPDALDPVVQEVARNVADAVIGMVVPLKWELFWSQQDGHREVSNVVHGRQYHVSNNGWWFPLSMIEPAPSLEAAKAAANAHHRAQILAALGLK